ncbi:MAG: hypothetical protein R2710_16115 [Acidimicrobiales bacterium]
MIALNLVGWNNDELPADLLGDVLAGAAEVAAEGGFFLVGGHDRRRPRAVVRAGRGRPTPITGSPMPACDPIKRSSGSAARRSA